MNIWTILSPPCRLAAPGCAAAAPRDHCFPARLEDVVSLESAIAADRQDASARYCLGNLFYDHGRHRAAISLGQKSASLDPDHSIAWRNLGIGWFNILDDPDRALAAYDRALAAAPDDARVLYERDQLWKRVGRGPAARLAELEPRPGRVAARAGARALYLTARTEAALEETRARVAEANPETLCAIAACDVTDAVRVEAAVADCVARFGSIDVADANAGILDRWVKIGESDPSAWWRNFEVNLQGAYHVARFTLPHLIASAKARAGEGRSGGHLILLSSIGAQLLVDGASAYQTAKHAINRLCEFVASDHGEDGIKCFAMHPGGVATKLGRTMPENMHAYLTDTPELAAGFAVWLCSGAADWATGRYLSATWDVGELVALKDEILGAELLVNRLRGKQ